MPGRPPIFLKSVTIDGFYRPQINTDWHRLRAKALIRGIIDYFRKGNVKGERRKC